MNSEKQFSQNARDKPFWFLYCETQICKAPTSHFHLLKIEFSSSCRQVKYKIFMRLEKWNWLRIKHEFFISRFAATRWYCNFVDLLRFEIMTSLWNSKNAGRGDGRLHLKQIICWSVSFLKSSKLLKLTTAYLFLVSIPQNEWTGNCMNSHFLHV